MWEIVSLRNSKNDRKLLLELKDIIPLFTQRISGNINFRKNILLGYLFNTSIVPYPLHDLTMVNIEKDYDLLSIKEINSYKKSKKWKHLKYYPRYIDYHEIQLYCLGYPFSFSTINDKKRIYKEAWGIFRNVNYGSPSPGNSPFKSSIFQRRALKIEVGAIELPGKVRIGITNVNVDFAVFEQNLKGQSTFNQTTRNIAADIINSAIKKKVDLLVMPECYVHYSWLPKLINIAKNNQMGMVFGLEHVIKPNSKEALNYIVTLLPYKLNEFNNCFVDMRLKNHYSPMERRYIENYFLSVPKPPLTYAMYNWRGLCFAPYSCFEIASLEDRVLFKSKVDAVVIVEWNKDVEYFSSIIESLSRDLHCYCIQVNSSEYGDNRITQPARSYLRDVIRAKGGKNDYLIVEDIDISQLRDFQIKDYGLQKEQEEKLGYYKPSPPGFDPQEVRNRGKSLDKQ